MESPGDRPTARLEQASQPPGFQADGGVRCVFRSRKLTVKATWILSIVAIFHRVPGILL